MTAVADNGGVDRPKVLDVKTLWSPVARYYGQRYVSAFEDLVSTYTALHDERVTKEHLQPVCEAIGGKTDEIVRQAHVYAMATDAGQQLDALSKIEDVVGQRKPLLGQLDKAFVDGRSDILLAALSYERALSDFARAGRWSFKSDVPVMQAAVTAASEAVKQNCPMLSDEIVCGCALVGAALSGLIVQVSLALPAIREKLSARALAAA